MSRYSRVRRIGAGFLILVVAGVLAGCGGEPIPPRLVHFSPIVLLVPTDETITIRAVYELNDFELTGFTWTAEAGDVEGDGGAEIVYAAPSEPGNYEITVTAAYGEGAEAGELSLAGVIRVIPGAADLVVDATGEPLEEAQPAASAGTNETEFAKLEATEGLVSAEGATAPVDEGPGAPLEEAETAASGGTAKDVSAAEEVVGDAASQKGPAEAADEGPGERAGSPEAADAETAETKAPVPTAGGGLASTAPVAGAAPGAGSRLDRIQGDERLIALVQIAFRPFSFEDDGGQRVGFDIDLVREFARRWLDDPSAVELLPVPTAQRIPKLLAGEADIIVAALTKTPERAAQVDFSRTYFQDGQRLLVAEGSEIASVCDLAGQQVAAIEGSTSLENLRREGSACGFEPNQAIVVFERHADAVAALLDGQVAAFTSDGLALEVFAADQPLEVVGNHFSEEPYGIAVPKGDHRLLDLVDATLVAMAADGTLAAIYTKWFGDEIAPYPLEKADLARDPGELAPLVTSEAPPLIEPESGEPADDGTETVQEYVVEPGDTLSKIAGKVQGEVSPTAWQQIYEANREQIGDDPSRIEVGMTLVIPE